MWDVRRADRREGIPGFPWSISKQVGQGRLPRVARTNPCLLMVILFFFNVWLWDGLKMVGCSAIIFFGLQVLLSFWVSKTRCFRAERVAGAEWGCISNCITNGRKRTCSETPKRSCSLLFMFDRWTSFWNLKTLYGSKVSHSRRIFHSPFVFPILSVPQYTDCEEPSLLFIGEVLGKFMGTVKFVGPFGTNGDWERFFHSAGWQKKAKETSMK